MKKKTDQKSNLSNEVQLDPGSQDEEEVEDDDEEPKTSKEKTFSTAEKLEKKDLEETK